MKVSEFIDELSRRLRDTNKRQWDQDFLVDAVNSAFTCMCNAAPSSHTIELDIVLKDGTRQEVPKPVHRIVDLLYNITPDGFPSEPVTNADRGAMDTAAPGWRMDDSRGVIKHWIPSSLEESTFDVWPKATEGMSIHGVFTKVPVINPDADNAVVNVPTVVVPEKPVAPIGALYTVQGYTDVPSDGNVALRFIGEDPVVVPPSGWQIPDGTILDVVIPSPILSGNILNGSELSFNWVVNSYDENYQMKDNDDYVRIYHGDPVAETGNYILDTTVAPEFRDFNSVSYKVSVFTVIDGTFDGARFDAVSSGENYAWLLGRFILGETVELSALVVNRGVGFHGYWNAELSAWVIVDGTERVI